jgi:retinol-binding protein 3
MAAIALSRSERFSLNNFENHYVKGHMIPKLVCRLVAFLCLSVGCGFAQTAVPDTPAGHTLQAWLDAFNSGDRAKVETYIKTVDPTQNVAGMMGFRNQTGGFDLVQIDSSVPLHLRFRLKERGARSTLVLGDLVVKDGQPPMVETIRLSGVPPGAVVENVTIDAGERKKVIDGVGDVLKEYYIELPVAQQMADALKAHEAKGDYNAISDGDTFASQLTKDLQAVSHDKHLRVNFNSFKAPPMKERTPEDEARFQKQMERDNCAFDKVEILPNNIGYIKFNGFMDAEFCGPTVVAAMGFVAHTDALIFDLRQNGGGQPAMVTMIASYLFD